MPDSSSAPVPSTVIGDIAGLGPVINSEVAKRAYAEGLSPAVKEIGSLSEDTLKTFRLFLAPLQLAAAYQDRFAAFCERVRSKVPEEEQRDAPAEIAKPVMEALASTSDASPLMGMFEELMAKAIDKREAEKLSPEFPRLIQSLSPFEALLIADLAKRDQTTDDVFDSAKNLIMQRAGANFDFATFGGPDHHLTLCQRLQEKKFVFMFENQPLDAAKEYPNLKVAEGLKLKRMLIRLTMFGKWFASACVPRYAP